MNKSSVIERRRKEILRSSIQKVTDDQQINWADVKSKVQQGDITYTLAVTIAQRKIEELDATQINEKDMRYATLLDNTRLIAHILFGVYMSLSLFQRPEWCFGLESKYQTTCNDGFTPVSNLPYLPTWGLIALEVTIITLLTARKRIQTIVEQRGKRKLKSLYALTLLIYLSEILQYALQIRIPFNQFLRPMFLVVYIKVVRRNLMLYMRIFWRSREIFIVIAGVFFFYVCLARIIFYQSVQNTPGTTNFDTFPDTLYNLFVSLTTSNYPDVMMPIFKENRMASLYFISFMAVVGLVLLHIILAYFYFNYKEELTRQAKRFQRKNSYKDLFADDSLDDLTEVNHQHGSSSFGRSFANHTELLQEMELLYQQDMDKQIGRSTWKRAIIETLNLSSVKTIFAMGSLLIFLLAVVESSEVNPDPETDLNNDEITYGRKFDDYWIVIEIVLNGFLLLDPFLRVTITGWKYFINSKFFVFEFFYSFVILLFLSLRLIGLTTITLTFIKLALIFRLYRFLKWVNAIEKYKLIFSSLFKLAPLFVHLLGVIGLAFYIYVTIGEVLFGGRLRTDLNINFSQYGDPSYYIYVNFNDFFMGLFTCFHLLIVNNWLYTVDVHCKVMGSYLYRIYFVSFYIITVTICLNIMIAFILDMFTTQISNKNAKSRRTNTMLGKKEVPENILGDWSPVVSPYPNRDAVVDEHPFDLDKASPDAHSQNKPRINLIPAGGNNLQEKLL